MKSIPTIKGLPFFGVAFEFKKDPLSYLKKQWKNYGDIFEFKVAGHKMVFVNRPEYIQHILLKNHKNYDKKNIMYREMQILFGQATSVVDGDRWKKGHQMIQPTFSFKKVEEMSVKIMDSIQTILKDWEKNAKENKITHLGDDLHRLTLEIIVKTMFGEAIEGKEEEITQNFKVLLQTIVSRILSPVPLPLGFPTSENRKYQKAIKSLDELIYKIIQNKIESKKKMKDQDLKIDESFDMLTMWLESSSGANYENLSLKTLRDEVIGIFVAAHGSTAVFLSWTLYHLSTHPEIQEKVYEEVKRTLGTRAAEYMDLPYLKYTLMVIEESMRMTPPGWIISRSTIGEDQLGDYSIPPKTMILISPYLMHHHTDFWEQPETFNPERFSESQSEQIKKASKEYYYIPFSGGPRICTGKNMAMVECLMIVATVIQKFKITLKKDHQIKPVGGFTLGLEGGLLVTLEVRV